MKLTLRILRGNTSIQSSRTLRALTTGHEAKEDTGGYKSFRDIPSASDIDDTSRLSLNDDPAYLHEQCDTLHQLLGPIFRKYLGPYELVFIGDTKMIQSVIHNEGPYPHHSVPPCWTYYNKVKNLERGVFFQTGEPWARLRKSLADVLLRDPKSITRFASDIIDINNDMMQEWRSRNKGQCEVIFEDVKRELCRWSIEATGFILFGIRMGCIITENTQTNHERAEQLVDNITEMFAMTSKFQVVPVERAHELDSEYWRRFEESMTNMLQISNDYAQEYMTKIKQSTSNTGLIKDMMDLGILGENDIRQSVLDLIIASADTTSTSLQWMLYLLASRRDSQSKIREESKILLSSKSDLNNYRDIAPYTSNFMKETLRLYPTAPFLARTLDQEIVLGNYRVPAGIPIVFSLYTTSRMSKYFEQPLAFLPERWFRHNLDNSKCPVKKNNSIATLPFGIGRRMCLGKRVAEFQIFLLLASLASTFDCFPIDDQVNIKLTMTLGPEKPIRIKLRPRE